MVMGGKKLCGLLRREWQEVVSHVRVRTFVSMEECDTNSYVEKGRIGGYISI